MPDIMPTSVSNQVSALTAILERMERQSDEDRRERKAESQAVNRALVNDRANAETARNAVSAELVIIRHGQDDVRARLAKIEPVTDLVTSWRGKLTGMLILLGFIGTLVTFAVVFFKEMILGWFQ